MRTIAIVAWFEGAYIDVAGNRRFAIALATDFSFGLEPVFLIVAVFAAARLESLVGTAGYSFAIPLAISAIFHSMHRIRSRQFSI